jgi:hypothetical protein
MNYMSEDISKISLALSKFQGAVTNVPKRKVAKVGAYSYKYADLSDMWEMIRTHLSENELAVVQTFIEHGNGCYLQTMIIHGSGQWIRSLLKMSTHVEDTKAGTGSIRKAKTQEIGSEMTYLKRYALSSILGIAADEDEDGSLANQIEEKAKKESNDEEETISAEQYVEISNLLGMIQKKDFSERLTKFFKISSIARLPEHRYEEAMDILSKQVKREETEQEAVNE